MSERYNPPLTASALRITRYGVPSDVLDAFVADRVEQMTDELLRQRRRVSYLSVRDWANELRGRWT